MAKFGAIPNTQNAALVMLLSRSTWAQDPHHYEDVFDAGSLKMAVICHFYLVEGPDGPPV